MRTDPALDAYHRSLASTRSPAQAGSAMAVAIDRAKASQAVQARLDALRDEFSGPYKAEGQVIPARPMFRINAGFNTKKMLEHAKEVDAIASRAGANGPAARLGYGNASNLVKVTQALIDAGKLPNGPPSTLASRIREMQWEYGVGVDCAAYTHYALAAATNKKNGFSLGIRPPGTEDFTGLGRNSSFASVPVKDVRPGDVITLTAPNDYGHNVIVYGHTVASAQTKTDLASRLPRGAGAMIVGPGPLHVLEVDSSWSAGKNGDAVGGFRRDTWLYDESTKMWGYVDKHQTPPAFVTSSVGPAGDVFHGAYRSKAARP